MLVVQPRSFSYSNKKLGSISIWSRVGHREISRSSVSELEVLVGKFSSIDRFTSSSISLCEVSSLNHKVRDNTMERSTNKGTRYTSISSWLYLSVSVTKLVEILSGFWNNSSKKFNLNITSWLPTNCNSHIKHMTCVWVQQRLLALSFLSSSI